MIKALLVLALQACSLAWSQVLRIDNTLPVCGSAPATSPTPASSLQPPLCRRTGAVALSGSTPTLNPEPLLIHPPPGLTVYFANVPRESWSDTPFDVTDRSTWCEFRTVPNPFFSGTPPQVTAINGRVLREPLSLFSFAPPYVGFWVWNTPVTLTVTGLEDPEWQHTSLVCFDPERPPTPVPTVAPTASPTTAAPTSAPTTAAPTSAPTTPAPTTPAPTIPPLSRFIRTNQVCADGTTSTVWSTAFPEGTSFDVIANTCADECVRSECSLFAFLAAMQQCLFLTYTAEDGYTDGECCPTNTYAFELLPSFAPFWFNRVTDCDLPPPPYLGEFTLTNLICDSDATHYDSTVLVPAPENGESATALDWCRDVCLRWRCNNFLFDYGSTPSCTFRIYKDSPCCPSGTYSASPDGLDYYSRTHDADDNPCPNPPTGFPTAAPTDVPTGYPTNVPTLPPITWRLLDQRCVTSADEGGYQTQVIPAESTTNNDAKDAYCQDFCTDLYCNHYRVDYAASTCIYNIMPGPKGTCCTGGYYVNNPQMWWNGFWTCPEAPITCTTPVCWVYTDSWCSTAASVQTEAIPTASTSSNEDMDAYCREFCNEQMCSRYQLDYGAKVCSYVVYPGQVCCPDSAYWLDRPESWWVRSYPSC